MQFFIFWEWKEKRVEQIFKYKKGVIFIVEQKINEKTIRKTLGNGRRSRKKIDMEKAYELIDQEGMTIEKTANYFGVHRSTLYKRHKEYQESIQEEMRNKLEIESDEILNLLDEDLPPIPPEFRF